MSAAEVNVRVGAAKVVPSWGEREARPLVIVAFGASKSP